MKDFNRIKLSDVAEVFSGFAFKSKDLGDVGLGVIKIGNIHAGTVAQECSGHFPKDLMTNKLKRFVLQANDTLVAMTGAGSVGRVGRMRRGHETYLVNQRVGIIRPDLSKVDPNYLGHYLSQPLVERTLYALGVGAGQPNISPAQVGTTEVKLPSLPTQERIAAILSAYDDLIENNTCRIAILEEMARRLYEEWFVHFRFPGHEEVEFDGELPKGWRSVPLKSVARLRSGYAFKSKTFTAEGEHRLVTIKNVQDGAFDPYNVNKLDDLPSNVPAHCYLSSGDVLLSLTGNVGRVCVVYGGDFLLNQRVAKIDHVSPDYRGFAYFTFRDTEFRRRLENLANGVAQQNLSPVKTEELMIALPTKELTERYEGFSGSVMAQCVQLEEINANLRAQRDLLLPKLVSGEIDVSEAEAGLEAAE